MTDTPAAPARRLLGNTAERYGAVAKAFHWTIAIAILVMIPLGLLAEAWPYDTAAALTSKAALFSAHKTLGVVILLVAVARIAWAVAQPKPGPLHPERRIETWLAGAAHHVLYTSLILVPLAGWVAHAASEGFAPIRWPLGQSLPLVPKSEAVYALASSLHVAFAWTLVAAVALHVAGALKHHLWDRDATLARMTPGQPLLPPIPPRRASWAPPVAALAVVLTAASVGAAWGLLAPGVRATEVAALPPLDLPGRAGALDLPGGAGASGWTVEEGRLAIAVTQLGGRIEGGFADWAATIAFDEAADPEGRHGEVEVAVSVASLTLGSVTAQALGTDFFAADSHPQALFRGEIRPAPEGAEADYVAQGTLALRGAEVPVTLPFALAIEGGRATMEGSAEVDRRAFAIGETFADPGTLGFEVEILVSLTAARSP